MFIQTCGVTKKILKRGGNREKKTAFISQCYEHSNWIMHSRKHTVNITKPLQKTWYCVWVTGTQTYSLKVLFTERAFDWVENQNVYFLFSHESRPLRWVICIAYKCFLCICILPHGLKMLPRTCVSLHVKSVPKVRTGWSGRGGWLKGKNERMQEEKVINFMS